MAGTQDYQLVPPASKCVFKESFASFDQVARNGGTVSGVTVNNGGVFAAASYIRYPAPLHMLRSTTLTLRFEFIPTFAPDDGVTHYFLYHASEAGDTWYIAKLSSNFIRADWKFTALTVALAAYQNYWQTGERNVLVVALSNGSCQAYLNNNLIQNAAAGIATAATTTTFYLGGNGANGFVGNMINFGIFDQKWTAQEVLDDYNNATYTYHNKSVLDLRMATKISDGGTGYYTLDSSGKGNNATLGDGSTPGTFPTKLAGRDGYLYDNFGNCYMRTNPVLALGTYSIVMWVEWIPYALYQYLFDARLTGVGYGFITAASGNISVSSGVISINAKANNVLTTGLNCIVINGITLSASGAAFLIGMVQSFTPNQGFNGRLLSFEINHSLTDTQIRDIYHRGLR